MNGTATKGSPIPEMSFYDISLPTRDETYLGDSSCFQAGNDVLQDRFPLDQKHGLGQGMGQFSHACTFTGGEYDCFHYRDNVSESSMTKG